jgi:hypothetical protein
MRNRAAGQLSVKTLTAAAKRLRPETFSLLLPGAKPNSRMQMFDSKNKQECRSNALDRHSEG